jgi:membrane protein YdbS with pleckstrin-like domain
LLSSFLTEDVTLNWFNLSFVGWVILIAALAIAGYKLGIQPVWIAIGALALLGIGIIVSVSHSKPRI